MKQVSDLIGRIAQEKQMDLKVERFEITKERFSLSGVASSYDILEVFKKEIMTLKPFVKKELVENNRSLPTGVQYRFSINL